MHERTYERLRSEAWEAERRAQERLAVFRRASETDGRLIGSSKTYGIFCYPFNLLLNAPMRRFLRRAIHGRR